MLKEAEFSEDNLERPERWLSVKEIAVHLGVSKETIYNRIENRTIPVHRVGRLWRFKASEVDKWVIGH